MDAKARVEIEFCTQCRWLLRAAWMAQELLLTFTQELREVALVPGTGGIFEVRVDGAPIWSRGAEGRFPELKQRLRDRIALTRRWDTPINRSSERAEASRLARLRVLRRNDAFPCFNLEDPSRRSPRGLPPGRGDGGFSRGRIAILPLEQGLNSFPVRSRNN